MPHKPQRTEEPRPRSRRAREDWPGAVSAQFAALFIACVILALGYLIAARPVEEQSFLPTSPSVASEPALRIHPSFRTPGPARSRPEAVRRQGMEFRGRLRL